MCNPIRIAKPCITNFFCHIVRCGCIASANQNNQLAVVLCGYGQTTVYHIRIANGFFLQAKLFRQFIEAGKSASSSDTKPSGVVEAES